MAEAVEGRLEACAARAFRSVEVLNFALSVISTAQELEIDRQIAAEFDPNLVMLMFVPNDVRSNQRTFSAEGGRRFCDLDPQGQLILDASLVESEGFRRSRSTLVRFVRRLKDYSRVAQLILEARRALERVRQDQQGQGRAECLSSPPRSQEMVNA